MIEWLLTNTNQLVASSNFTISILMGIFGLTALYYLSTRKYESDLFYLLVGITLEALGWCIHRMYWGVWRVYKLYGNEPMVQWYEDYGWVSLGPLGMIFIGLIFVLGPVISWLASIKSRLHYFAISAMFALSIQWFMFWKLGDAFEADRQLQYGKTVIESVIPEKESLKESQWQKERWRIIK